ncbi:MAG: peptide ABC transporter substrate-binding protein [Eubacteriales bacterium]
MKKRILAAMLASVMVMSLVACGGSETTTATTEDGGSTTTAEASTDSEDTFMKVTTTMTTDPSTLDPGRSDDTQKNAIILESQETLLRLIDGELTEAGAESYTISDDGLVWTFTLRENGYSDGTQVVAQDYVNSIRRVFDPEVNCHNAGIFYCIVGGEEFNTGVGTEEDVAAVALDDLTLEITLTESLPYFAQLLTFANITPVPESKTEGDANSTYGGSAEELSQCGPFYVSEWTKGSKVVLTKNPYYWDAENIQLDEVEMLLAEEVNTRQQLFDAGEIDIITSVTSEYLELKQDTIDSGEVILDEGPLPRNTYICFNNEDPDGVFSNANIRKAFAIAFNRDDYAEKVLGTGTAALGEIPYGTAIGSDLFRDLYEEPMQELLDQDAVALLELGLEEIGRAGETLEVTFMAKNSDTTTKTAAEYYQAQWQEKLGVVVNIVTAADNSTFNNTVSSGLYQICETGWGADYNDPMTFMQCYTTGDGNNPAFYSNEEYDELVYATMTEQDNAVRAEYFAQAEYILTVEDCGISPVTFAYQNTLISSSLKNVYVNGAGGPDIEYRDAYIEE